MDVESKETIMLAVAALEAAVGRQLAQATTDITAALDQATAQAANELSGIVQGALTGIQAIASKAAADLDAIVGRLDGATASASIKLGSSKTSA